MSGDSVYRAVVSDTNDPQGLGRVKLKGARRSRLDAWLPVGTVAAPRVGDEVLVAHEDGDAARPVIIGSLQRDALELRFAGSDVVLAADGVVRMKDASGNSIVMAPAGITILAAGKVDVQTSLVHVSAQTVTVDAAMSHFAGVVECDTLIANSVVAQSDTPAAGNAH